MKNTLLKILLPLMLLIISNSVEAQPKEVTVEVLYFHATIRCQGCLTIEENIKNSLDFYYDKELKNKMINYFSLDFLKPENQHYQEKYDFDAQSLIIRKVVDGKVTKWKNLDKIWDYSNDFEKFSKYVKKEIDKMSKES